MVRIHEEQFRGLTFTPLGQRVSTWLPAGEYGIVADCVVADRDGQHEATKLERFPDGAEWYVGRFIHDYDC